MRAGSLLPLLLALGGCSQSDSPAQREQSETSADLESAAIARGLVRDGTDADLTGLYARDTERLCIVPAGYGYRIGATLDYGGGIGCSARGMVSRVGDTLTIDFGEAGCSFDARFDGDAIVFPGALPDACAALCRGRASFAGVRASLLSDSAAEAEALRASDGTRLCAVS